jgi:Cof subfamily protein (haloacid dehalogenase superfamily)
MSPSVRAVPAGLVKGARFGSWAPARPAWVVCDVDGTLLDRADQPSAAVVAAVRAARDAGLRVGLATGRVRHATEPLLAALDADGPHVFHNGAEVRLDGEVIASSALDLSHLTSLLALARSRDDVYVEIYTDESYLVSARDERATAHWDMLGHPPAGVIGDPGQLDGRLVPKATLVGFDLDPAAADALTDEIRALGMAVGSARSPRTPWLTYLNITRPEVDKGVGAAHGAQALGIGLDEVAAVGDDLNDVPLFERVGTAIAMGQADRPVLEAAHLLAPSVDDDGAARALESLTRLRAGQLPGREL